MNENKFKNTHQLLKILLIQLILTIIIFIEHKSLMGENITLSLFLLLYPHVYLSTFLFSQIREITLMRKILGIPLYIFSYLFPVVVLLNSLILFFISIIITLLITYKLSSLFGIEVTDQINIFISLTLSSIIYLLFSEKILSFISRKIESKKKQEKDFTTIVINQNNIRFWFYLAYFCCLTIIYWLKFNNSLSQVYIHLSEIILASFVTSLAFDKLIPKKKTTDARWKNIVEEYKNNVREFLIIFKLKEK